MHRIRAPFIAALILAITIPVSAGATLKDDVARHPAATSLRSARPAPAAPQQLRRFEVEGRSSLTRTTARRATPAAVMSGPALVVVNQAWAGHSNGTLETVGMNTYTFGTDAFAAIQDGINAVATAGTVKVLPGSYNETAAGSFLYDASGPYQFGLFIGQAKGAITVEGTDGSGAPITSAASVVAHVTTNATNDFGASGVFVEADGATISGLGIGVNIPGSNKTLEIIGDAFTLRYCIVEDAEGSLYMDDWRYDAGLNVSHVKSYTVQGNLFQPGNSIDIASGTGYSGPTSGRVISGNTFNNVPGETWPEISFNGSGTPVPWFVYSVGGAVITGNTFHNTEPLGQYIRTRGTVDDSQYDWAAYWNGNTFGNGAAVGPTAPALPRAFSYVSGPYTFTNVRHIGTDVPTEVGRAQANDIVVVQPGAYSFSIGVTGPLTLRGPNAGICANGGVRGPEAVITPNGATAIRILGTSPVTIDGFEFSGGTNNPIDSYDTGNNPTIIDNRFTGSVVYVFLANSDVVDYECNYHTGMADDEGLFLAGNSNGTTGTRATINNNGWVSTPSSGMNLSDVRATVTNNTFTNVQYYGVLLANNSGGSTVSNNTFTGIINPSPLTVPTYGAGVRFYTPGVTTPVSITGNHFLSSYLGVAVRKGSPAADITGMPISVTGNDFIGNTEGVRNDADAGTLSATCNWWGNLLGPNAPPANPSPGDKAVGAVSYAPWLNGSITGAPLCNQYGPNNIAASWSGACLTPANLCLTVPVMFNRADTSPARGASVTIQLSPNLQLCNTNPAQLSTNFHVGTWLAAYARAFQVVDNGGGSYTIDQSILGSPCGKTTGGLLFTVDVAKAPSAGDGTGTITVTAVDVRDCLNNPLAALPGAPANITIDYTAPGLVTDLAAAQVLSGNGANPTTGVRLTWATGGAGTVALYRAPFGSYPEYDDDAPVTAPNPVLAPSGPWTLVNATATSPYVDVNPVRGFWHYVAIVTDACGNASAVSNMTGGTLNYLLGDVSNGVTAGVGNDMVYAEDISLLGAHYGIAGEAAVDAFDYLDVGPTITHLPDSRPKPDDKINFEDLMIFAINYGSPGAQLMQSIEAPVADHDAITVAAPGTVMAGGTFTVELRMSGAGDIQGVTSQLAWDARVATPLAVHAGELLAAANGVAFSAQPGNVDVALLGSRRQGLSGEGVLATVTFRALASGDPQVSLARVEARDADNQAVALSGVPVGPVTPRETALLPVTPNPFRDAAMLGFSLAKDAPVELSIYSVDGRRVATIAQGAHAAGVYHLRWDGTDTHGSRVGAGVFYARLSVAGREFTRRLVYLK